MRKFSLKSVVADFRMIGFAASMLAYLDLAWIHLLKPEEMQTGIAYAILAVSALFVHMPRRE